METVTSHLPFIRIEIPDALDAKIRAFQPEYLDRKGFLCLVLDQALDTPVTIPAYRVGAGKGLQESASLQSTFAASQTWLASPVRSKTQPIGGSA